MTEAPHLLVREEDAILIATFNRPEKLNAMSMELMALLEDAVLRFRDTPELKVMLIRSTGRYFSAGADLKGRASVIKGPGDLPAHSRRTRECFHAIRECAKPVVVAINGAALGSGLAMVASGDILIASDKATVGLPEVDVGLLGGSRHAMRLFSHSRLRRMALTGMRVSAAELLRLGIVEACVAPEELMPAALEIAMTIASKSPVSTRMGKHTLNVVEEMGLRDGYRYEQDMTAQIGKSDDAKEAQRAFAEKRAPVFTGR